MNTERIEKIGQLSDTIDNLLHAMQLPLPPKMHLDSLKGNLESVRDELREIYTEETGDNPWAPDESPTEPAPEPELPTTLEAAIAYVMPGFKGMENFIKKYDENEFAAFCHSQLSGGIGMQIRNRLHLWIQNSELHQYFLKEHNLYHPDSMSDLIIRGVYQKMKPVN